MIGLLLAMYPARWRRRYGEEFRAILESRALGPFDVADVLLGALDARLTPLRLPGAARVGGHVMLLRLGGFGAVIGGVACSAARALGLSSAGALIVAFFSMGGGGSGAAAQVFVVVSLAAFAVSWMWLGVSALRRGPIRAVSPG